MVKARPATGHRSQSGLRGVGRAGVATAQSARLRRSPAAAEFRPSRARRPAHHRHGCGDHQRLRIISDTNARNPNNYRHGCGDHQRLRKDMETVSESFDAYRHGCGDHQRLRGAWWTGRPPSGLRLQVTTITVAAGGRLRNWRQAGRAEAGRLYRCSPKARVSLTPETGVYERLTEACRNEPDTR